MKTRHALLLGMTSFMAFGVMGANAASYNFYAPDASDSGATKFYDSLGFTGSDGTNATVTAGTLPNRTAGSTGSLRPFSADLAWYKDRTIGAWNGIGVRAIDPNGTAEGVFSMENDDGADFIKLTFDKAVSLDQIGFHLESAGIDADITISSVFDANRNASTWKTFEFNSVSPLNSSANISKDTVSKGLLNYTLTTGLTEYSNTWYIAADLKHAAGDKFFITGIEASASPVPLPAAAWLFGSALLGVFGFGARRRAG